jgi:hypothetical protein
MVRHFSTRVGCCTRRLWNHKTRRNLEPHKTIFNISDYWSLMPGELKNGKTNLPFVQTDWLAPAKFWRKYPVNKITNVYNFEKYGTQSSLKLTYWSVAQVLITLVIISFYLIISETSVYLTSLFMAYFLLSIYSYTELMDKNKSSIYWESLRFLSAISYIFRKLVWLNSLFQLATIQLQLILYFHWSWIFILCFWIQRKKGISY